MSLVFRDVIPYIPDMIKGLGISIFVTLIGMVIGLLLGLFIAYLKGRKNTVVSFIGRAYIEIFRNTPLLIQLYLLYFGLGQLGVNINPLWSAIIGLILNNSAYTAEIFRAGVSGVPKGLKEAGTALGMSAYQVFQHIVLLPAIKNALPALTNQFILLFLFSSVASVISLGELTHQIMNIQSLTARPFETILIGIVLYYSVSFIIGYVSQQFERKVFNW